MDSGLKNVDRTHLVLVSGKLVLQKKFFYFAFPKRYSSIHTVLSIRKCQLFDIDSILEKNVAAKEKKSFEKNMTVDQNFDSFIQKFSSKIDRNEKKCLRRKFSSESFLIESSTFSNLMIFRLDSDEFEIQLKS